MIAVATTTLSAHRKEHEAGAKACRGVLEQGSMLVPQAPQLKWLTQHQGQEQGSMSVPQATKPQWLAQPIGLL